MGLEGVVEVERKNIIGGRVVGRADRRMELMGSAVSFASLRAFFQIHLPPLLCITCHFLISYLCCVLFFPSMQLVACMKLEPRYTQVHYLRLEFRASIAVPSKFPNLSTSHAQFRTPIHAPTTTSCSLPAKH